MLLAPSAKARHLFEPLPFAQLHGALPSEADRKSWRTVVALPAQPAYVALHVSSAVRMLDLTKALLALTDRKRRLVLLTSGVHGSLGAGPPPSIKVAASSCAIGFGRVLRFEYPAFDTQSVDALPVTDGLVNRLSSAKACAPEPEVAWRASGAQVPRLRRGSYVRALGLRKLNGTIAITGGLGGLGLVTAARLIDEAHVPQVVLCSRGLIPREAAGQAQLRAMQQEVHATLPHPPTFYFPRLISCLSRALAARHGDHCRPMRSRRAS